MSPRSKSEQGERNGGFKATFFVGNFRSTFRKIDLEVLILARSRDKAVKVVPSYGLPGGSRVAKGLIENLALFYHIYLCIFL